MSPNPFEPPRAGPPDAAIPGRTMFVLAGIGGFLASGYWALMTLLIGAGVASGSISGTQIILPGILIVLYAMRGAQILKGDVAAAQRILWLHAIGAIAALLQLTSAGPLFAILQSLKIVIHIFGGTTAFLARKAVVDAMRGGQRL